MRFNRASAPGRTRASFIFTNASAKSSPLRDEFQLPTINARTGSSERLSAFHLCIDREESRGDGKLFPSSGE